MIASTSSPQDSAAAAALSELLSTPAVTALLQAGRPTRLAHAAPQVVRTLLWRDVNTSMSLASDLPDLVNALFETLATLGEELQRLPNPVLTALVTDRVGALDLHAARRAGRAWLDLALRLAPGMARAAGAGAQGADTSTAIAADTSTAIAKALGTNLVAPLMAAWTRWLESHPGGLHSLASALLAPVDPDTLRQGAERTAHELAVLFRDHPALGEALARLLANLAWEAVQGSIRSVGSSVGSRLRRG